MHEKIQRQNHVGSLINNQKRTKTKTKVPRIHRLSTGRQPLVNLSSKQLVVFFASLYKGMNARSRLTVAAATRPAWPGRNTHRHTNMIRSGSIRKRLLVIDPENTTTTFLELVRNPFGSTNSRSRMLISILGPIFGMENRSHRPLEPQKHR